MYAFHLRKMISTVLGQVDNGGQDGNTARRNPNPGRNVRNRPHPKTTLLLRCYLPNHKSFGCSEVLYGSDLVLLGVVIRKYETPTTNISHEKGHGIFMTTCQIVAYN